MIPIRLVCVIAAAVSALILLLPARAAHRWPRPPAAWLHSSTAQCVVRRESGGNVHERSNPGSRGKWQFQYSTWSSVGGRGDPADASEAEQDWRAYVLYRRSGWGPWTNYDGC